MTINDKREYIKTFDIEWGDMDALGHVNNGRYFDYFQQGRIEWLQTLGFGLGQVQGPVVIKVACTFNLPIIYPARLTLKNKAHSLGRTSMVMDHNLYQEDKLMAEGMSKIVWVDYKANQSIPIPDDIRKLFD